MSPQAICTECGKEQLFHEDELAAAKAGDTRCMECSLEHSYYVFLGEVLDGKHPDLIKELEERLKEEA